MSQSHEYMGLAMLNSGSSELKNATVAAHSPHWFHCIWFYVKWKCQDQRKETKEKVANLTVNLWGENARWDAIIPLSSTFFDCQRQCGRTRLKYGAASGKPPAVKTQFQLWADATRCPQNSGYSSGWSGVSVAVKSVHLARRKARMTKQTSFFSHQYASCLGMVTGPRC